MVLLIAMALYRSYMFRRIIARSSFKTSYNLINTVIYRERSNSVCYVKDCVPRKYHIISHGYSNTQRSRGNSGIQEASFVLNGQTYSVKAYHDKDTSIIGSIIQRAAEWGNNVGDDEFNHEKIARLVSWSDTLTVGISGNIIGIIFLHPSYYCRRLIGHVGFFQIFLAETDARNAEELYGLLVDLSVRKLQHSCKGYVGAMTHLFGICTGWLEQLQKQNFYISAIIPLSGNFKGHSDQDSYLLYQKFDDTGIQGKVCTIYIQQAYGEPALCALRNGNMKSTGHSCFLCQLINIIFRLNLGKN